MDSLLLVESRDAKKSPQEEDQPQEKPKAIPVEKNDADESADKEQAKDGE